VRKSCVLFEGFFLFVFITLLVGALPARAEVSFVINNLDPAGLGFNDPTPADPVGGNPGTTLGAQRLNALRFALELWGSILDSDVEVVVQTFFTQLQCEDVEEGLPAILAKARPLQVVADFEGTPLADTWYQVALANSLVGTDMTQGPPDPIPDSVSPNDDLLIRFNIDIDENPDCFTGSRWYYGFDASPGDDFSFVQVALHEAAHGLGFSNYMDEESGTLMEDKPDIFVRNTYDNLQDRFWDEMTNAERSESARSCGHVVWGGKLVTRAAPAFLSQGFPTLTIHAPGNLPDLMLISQSEFGPPLSLPGVKGKLVEVDDGVGVRTNACEPLTPENARAVRGNIALIDRGICPFTLKVEHAQEAGALGVVFVDNAVRCPAGRPQGVDEAIHIPSGMISIPDGNLLRAALPGVVVSLGINPDLLLGADGRGLVLLQADNPVLPETSIIHWEELARPYLLMESNPDYKGGFPIGVDLTAFQLADIGWRLSTVSIGGCDTGAPNVPLPGGGTLSDLVDACTESSGSKRAFKRCISDIGRALHRLGLLTGEELGGLQHCAAPGQVP